MKAYDLFVRGQTVYYKATPEGIAQGRQYFEKALELDPDFNQAAAFLGWTYLLDVVHGYSRSPKRSMEKALELANRALSMDDSLADTHTLLTFYYILNRAIDRAVAYGERAVALNPNSADAWMLLSAASKRAGKYEEGMAQIRKALRLNPYPPFPYFLVLSHSHLILGQYKEAVAASLNAYTLAHESTLSFPHRIIAYMEWGREDKARAEAGELLRLDPKFSVESFIQYHGHHKDPAVAERWRNALYQAGLK
ncbi:MAG: tetratricopeptide repeat protein [Candidatus Binatia bacterium]